MNEAVELVKATVDGIIVTDWADTDSGCVVFSTDNQALLVSNGKVSGLNWSYRPHGEIIRQALDRIER